LQWLFSVIGQRHLIHVYSEKKIQLIHITVLKYNTLSLSHSASAYLLFQCLKYLGHAIDNKLHDDVDVYRELKCLFTRANILIWRFSRCSSEVKIRLFRSFCVCFYDIALWRHVKVTVLNKLWSVYVISMKMVFNFPKYSSVRNMLIRLGLPSFSTLSHNAEWTFVKQSSLCNNRLVSIVHDICMYSY